MQKQSATYRHTVLVCAAIIAYLANVELEFRRVPSLRVATRAHTFDAHAAPPPHFQLAVSRVLQNCGLDQNFSMRSLLNHTSVLYVEKREKMIETYTIIDYTQKAPFIIDPHGESHRMLPRLLDKKMVVVDVTRDDILEVVSGEQQAVGSCTRAERLTNKQEFCELLMMG